MLDRCIFRIFTPLLPGCLQFFEQGKDLVACGTLLCRKIPMSRCKDLETIMRECDNLPLWSGKLVVGPFLALRKRWEKWTVVSKGTEAVDCLKTASTSAHSVIELTFWIASVTAKQSLKLPQRVRTQSLISHRAQPFVVHNSIR